MDRTGSQQPHRPMSLVGSMALLAIMLLIPALAPVAGGIWSMLLVLVLIIVGPAFACNYGSRTKPLFMFYYHGERTVVMDEISEELAEPTATRKR